MKSKRVKKVKSIWICLMLILAVTSVMFKSQLKALDKSVMNEDLLYQDTINGADIAFVIPLLMIIPTLED